MLCTLTTFLWNAQEHVTYLHYIVIEYMDLGYAKCRESHIFTLIDPIQTWMLEMHSNVEKAA